MGVVDLGLGNMSNVLRAVRGTAVRDVYGVERASALIIPGVGSFSAAMPTLETVREAIIGRVREGIPVLGICLGLQLLYEGSEEGPGRGLSIFRGTVKRFSGVRVPHIGWNQVEPSGESVLLKGIRRGEFFYFVHSYYAPVSEFTRGLTDYGGAFSSVVEKGNVFGVQFHPEKSGQAGARVLRNFGVMA
ncbi:imidazole glycerol phosphate synthase subunit HisH [Thermogymnomonas acidicola]|nr:imidazole glycerol phosphate synthase subunit HisH [Thermogymnomonas acidicola]